MNASAPSCKHDRALLANFRSDLKSWAIWNGRRWMRRLVDFWYLRISRSATVPGRKRFGFFMPAVIGADLRAAFEANCLRGALPPVDLRAIIFVRAILSRSLVLSRKSTR